jgi:hypothetical protein
MQSLVSEHIYPIDEFFHSPLTIRKFKDYDGNIYNANEEALTIINKISNDNHFALYSCSTTTYCKIFVVDIASNVKEINLDDWDGLVLVWNT